MRSALCIAIGTLGSEAAESTSQVLKQLFAKAAGGGTHSAAAWALQQQGLTPEQLSELVLAEPDTSDRGWYVSKHGITMLKIPATQFGIGPVDDNENPAANAKPESLESFWLSDREITVGQFRAMKGETQPSAVDSQLPMTRISWFDAVEFCNWLSEEEDRNAYYKVDNIKRDQQGFIQSAEVTETEHKRGYRLPTEREWEYACRAMTTTDYCYGDDVALLSEYAAFNLPDMIYCGLRKPNGWGLFDMHGNVYEWCHDEDGASRVVRGGSFDNSDPQILRSAYRGTYAPVNRNYIIGFRLSRTP